MIDYEKMVDSKGRRMVAFGKYAGVVGKRVNNLLNLIE